MGNFDDVSLRRPADPPAGAPPPGPNFHVWVPVIVLGIIALGLVLWYFGMREAGEEDRVVVREETEQALPLEPPAERLPEEPGDDIDLPPLDESDALIRSLISALSSHPRVMAYLTTDHLVRNMTVVVVNIADGRTPSNHLRAVRPQGDFQVRSEGRELIIDPRSYQRYDGHADAVQGLDAQSVARFYATIRPRIDDAYGDLGNPHGDFDQSLERAIVELLRTPMPDDEVRVRADSVAYSYDDRTLEGLSHAQRQFLRMGPRNMRIVKAKLRQVAQHVGIPESRLPR
jgi:hypothetical protein